MHLHSLPPLTLRDLVAANDASATRSKGVHVTDVVREILVKIDPQRYSKDYGDASANWQEAGFVWEDILSRVFASRSDDRRDQAVRWRPGELSKDGIAGSPDALCIEPALVIEGAPGVDRIDRLYRDQLLVEEYKCTWKSSRGFDLYDKRYLWWLIQMQAYCYLADTTLARLYVLHINGNYEGYIPMTSAYLLEFPQQELDDAWASLVNTARSKGWFA